MSRAKQPTPQPLAQRPAMQDYGISDEPDGLLPWSFASQRMAAARNYWIGSSRPDGRPHAAPVWGVWLDDVFYFGTVPGSVKARNLAANPALVVHLESGDEVVI
ncbi:MAG TPA: pyridoxamine 5'-phosphate oxidase family protein, partial [Anaerolineae bacterium]|nr:pyridoxamine 5'-phosphate oxidase family protein [Anaerolineae bacterium]